MDSYPREIEKTLNLKPYIQKIQTGEIPQDHISILYTILLNTYEVCIHQQKGAKDNKVYVSSDGHKEAVYGKDGKLVKDGVNDGTYNYFGRTEDPLRHFTFDISPWIMWGMSRNEDTTVESRIYAYMGDLEVGIREALKQPARPIVEFKENGQIQAVAVFLRAIDEGGAKNLFSLFEMADSVADDELIKVLTSLRQGLEKVY